MNLFDLLLSPMGFFCLYLSLGFSLDEMELYVCVASPMFL